MIGHILKLYNLIEDGFEIPLVLESFFAKLSNSEKTKSWWLLAN